MLNQQDLFFFLTVLGQGVSGRMLVEACAACASNPHVDLPAMLLQQRTLDQQQVDLALQALQVCLERNNWRKDEVLQELVRSAGADRLEECWEAASAARTDLGGQPAERYVDRQLHAEGGLGRIWQARDHRMGRIVALKDLRPELADREAVLSRFIQEAQITSQLEHPNIIPVYDLHHGQAGALTFYTMKFISGRTLQDALEQFHQQPAKGRWSSVEFHRLLYTFAQVCEAVAYAHSRGIIHRDLKPANVALGEFNAVMVIDWGLARRAAEPDTIATVEAPIEERFDRTRAGDVLGTPAYMAPEQAAGALDRIGPATDIYGLGAMLFAILTGQPPHLSQLGEQAAAYLQRIAATGPPAAKAIQLNVPPALDAICARAMAPAPADRYAGAADLAADVHRWLAGEAVTAYRERWPHRLGRWLKLHPAWTQAAASIALLLMVTASIIITNSWATERTLSVVGQANLEQEAQSLDDIYQSRIDDFLARARVFAQLPALAEVLKQDRQPGLQQGVEDMIRTVVQLRPEYLEVGVIRRQPWTHVVQLTRNQPGDPKLHARADQAVTFPPLLEFLDSCQLLAAGQIRCAIVPPARVGVSATLWVGVKVHAPMTSQEAGIVLLVADVQRLLQTPEATGLGGGYVHIVSAAGTILTKPVTGETHPAVGEIIEHNPALAPYFASRPLTESGTFHSADGASQLTACRRLVVESGPAAEELVLVVERPLAGEAQESARAYRLVMGLTALVIVAALALTYGLVRLLAGHAGSK